MSLRLVTAIAGERARRPSAFALLLLLAVMRIVPAPAQDSDDAYSATVKVDATADSAAAARDLARIDGQRRALAAVVGRLSNSSEPATLPKLDDKAITDMVASFEVANERMSATHYVADYTFHFRPARLRRLIRVVDTAALESGSRSAAEGATKPGAESGGRSIVVLPVYRDGANLVLWNDPNAWRSAWVERPAGSGPTRLRLPLGDAGDLAAIDADRAESGDAAALTAIVKQNGGGEAAVALATARRQDGRLAGIDVTVKRYRSGHLVDSHVNSYDATPGESETDFLRRAADALAADIESVAMKTAGGASNQQASLAVTVPITSLGEWLRVRDRLVSVSSIRKVDLLSLSHQEAKIEVRYIGSQDQLKSSLAEVDLELGGGDPVWRIEPSHVTSPR
jgi:hypothetical protein